MVCGGLAALQECWEVGQQAVANGTVTKTALDQGQGLPEPGEADVEPLATTAARFQQAQPASPRTVVFQEAKQPAAGGCEARLPESPDLAAALPAGWWWPARGAIHGMQVWCRHHINPALDITDAMRSYVTNKFERLERHFDHMTNVHVILSVEKLRQKAEASFHISGHDVYADSEHEDMYAAIDTLVDKLDRQVLKHKERMKNHR